MRESVAFKTILNYSSYPSSRTISDRPLVDLISGRNKFPSLCLSSFLHFLRPFRISTILPPPLQPLSVSPHASLSLCDILWCCCTRAPSTGARLSPRLSTLFHFGCLSRRSRLSLRPSRTSSFVPPTAFQTPALASNSASPSPRLLCSRVPSPLRLCRCCRRRRHRLGRLPVSLRDFREPLFYRSPYIKRCPEHKRARRKETDRSPSSDFSPSSPTVDEV